MLWSSCSSGGRAAELIVRSTIPAAARIKRPKLAGGSLLRPGPRRPHSSRWTSCIVTCRSIDPNLLQLSLDKYILSIYTLDMKKAKLFKNGESQAVRLPKEFRFRGTEVFIKRQGSAVVLLPEDASWDILIESTKHFTNDFMRERNQPPLQNRKGFDE